MISGLLVWMKQADAMTCTFPNPSGFATAATISFLLTQIAASASTSRSSSFSSREIGAWFESLSGLLEWIRDSIVTIVRHAWRARKSQLEESICGSCFSIFTLRAQASIATARSVNHRHDSRGASSWLQSGTPSRAYPLMSLSLSQSVRPMRYPNSCTTGMTLCAFGGNLVNETYTSHENVL